MKTHLRSRAARLLVLALAVAAASAGARAQVDERLVRASGRIDAVTVYRGQAMVTRSVEIDTNRGPGVREVVVSGLPSRILPDSLFAEGEGLEVRSVLYRESAALEDVRASVRELDQQIAVLQRELELIERQRQVQTDHLGFLGKLENFAAPTATAELRSGVLNADTLVKLTGFLLEQRKTSSEADLKLSQRQSELKAQVELLGRQREGMARGAARTLREAVVLVETRLPQAKLKLMYLVSDASWTPAYNIRQPVGGGEPEGVTVEYNASVRQMSGEDWGDVVMRLSTATPTLVAVSPSLDALTVALTSADAHADRRADDYSMVRRELRERQREVDSMRNAGPQVSQEGGLKAGGGQAPEAELNTVAARLQILDLLARDADLKQTSATEDVAVTYDLPGRTTLPSRADRQQVQVATMKLPAVRVKVATPVLTPYVFDHAEVSNGGGNVLLAGEVQSFARGQFVGRGVVPTVATGQSFTAGFGIDPSLRASRELLDRKESISGGNKVSEFTYRLRIENYGTTPAALRLLDRIPFSKDPQIKVGVVTSTVPLSKDSEYESAEARKNILRWDVQVPASAVGSRAFVVDYTFRIEHDRNMVLGGASASTGG